MIEPEPTNEGLIAAEKREYASRRKALLVGGAIVGGVALGVATGVLHAFLTRAGIAPAPTEAIVYIVFIVGSGLMVWGFTRTEGRARIACRDIDGEARNIRYALPVMALGLFYFAYATWDALTAGRCDVTDIGSFCLLAVASAVTVGLGGIGKRYRAALSDEGMQAIRRQSATAGFLTLTVTTCTAFVVACYRPDWAVPALAAAICVGLVVPLGVHTILDIRTDRREEP